MITTLAERKSRDVARLKAGFAQATEALAAYARERNGRFVVFGSFARDQVHPGSDCDVMVDFSESMARDARNAAETILREYGLRPDVHLLADVSEGLMRRIVRDGITLP